MAHPYLGVTVGQLEAHGSGQGYLFYTQDFLPEGTAEDTAQGAYALVVPDDYAHSYNATAAYVAQRKPGVIVVGLGGGDEETLAQAVVDELSRRKVGVVAVAGYGTLEALQTQATAMVRALGKAGLTAGILRFADDETTYPGSKFDVAMPRLPSRMLAAIENALAQPQ